MIPWPIALLTACYALLGTSSAATLWQVAQGQLHRSVVWPGIWCAVSAALVIGLAFLKPWARRLAVWASVLMLVSSLGAALLAILPLKAEPVHSLVATGMAGVQLIVIRYLTRPHVKRWFENQTQDTRPKTQVLSPES